MKKSLIALAIAALSSNAFAVDFTDPASTASKYASEITLPAVLTDAGTSLDATFKLGFSATMEVKRYVRIDLTNAVFENPVVPTDLSADAADVNFTDLAASVSTGGTKGASSVVIEINPQGAGLANTDKLTLALTKLKATGGDIGIKYRLYETGVAAAAPSNDTLSEASGTLVSFTPALSAKATANKSIIDVNQLSTYFEDGATKLDHVTVGSVAVAVDNTVLTAAGTAADISVLVESAKLEVSGDFSAGKKTDGALAPAALTLAGSAADTITTTKATYNTPAAGGAVVYTVDGTTAIAVQTITAKYTPVANPGYTLSAIDLGTLGTLEKNGSTQEANLVLAPDTAYTNLVRISNTSSIAGKFYITAIADDGKSVTFPLSDVAGQPASLDAGASTTQMKVKDIFAAAEAKGLALTGEKKLRLKVEGEVGSLSLQTYTVSKDGNALNSLNAF